ncbi:LysR family transcriptional regulator [Cytobacillus purgationiresistens]|uniref:DNA-binding transcriptional LysR family regulator n=1 Tax=Cytobacillus purgationiresistens TaxID=863449 RepID=A0ABU0AGR4_9BACI|nr:LysR family transcriptional regulator [Cytobacillus purgationiresistens]MDQ0270444.1 DNA-binding transcriptional LysR family regulator [Cytobacillus purgationiresistens]
MDLLQMKYFEAVARHQHLTKAAAELNVSQPALSKMISKLEQDLGYELFDRTGRQIKLNKYGEAYKGTVEKVFLEMKIGERELAFLAEKQNDLITVAVTIPLILPDLFGGFLEKQPRVRFRQYHASSERMSHQLQIGEIDVGISTVPIIGNDIEWYPVLEEDILMSVPITHPLANRESIFLKELEHDPFIVMSAGYGFRDMTERFCEKAGFYPNFAFEGDETGVTYELVEKGLGVAFCPSIIKSKRSESLNIAKLKIKEPECTRIVGVVWHKRRAQSEMVKEFIAFTINFLKKQI